MESMRFHGPNVVSCEIISGLQRKPFIGAYLPLTTLEHLTYPEEALNRFPRRYPIIMRDLNADVRQMGNPQNNQVEDFLESFGLVYLLARMPLSAWSQNGAGSGMLISICQHLCADLMLAYAFL